jgi:hypothetical protein
MKNGENKMKLREFINTDKEYTAAEEVTAFFPRSQNYIEKRKASGKLIYEKKS